MYDALAKFSETVIWTFICLTPLLLALFEYAKTAKAGGIWPNKAQVTWRAIAAMIAVAVWSLSVPGNLYQDAMGGTTVAGLLAVLISPIVAAVHAIVLSIIGKPSTG